MIATKSIEVIPSFQLETLPAPHKKRPIALVFMRFAFGILSKLFPRFAANWAFQIFTKPRVKATHKTSDEVLESARIFEFLHGTNLLKGYEWGAGERTILLVHGWESRGTAMRSFVPGLLAAGYRVVTFDAPAHGDSAGERTNLPEYASAVRAFIKKVGGVESIVTHSFGGAAAVYALAHLDDAIEIEKLVLIAAPASTQKVVHHFVKLVNLSGKAYAIFRNNLRQKMRNLPFEQADIKHGLEKVKVKEVLIVHDKTDPSVSFESAEEIFERYDHVSLLVTHGFGHYKLMKQPEVIEPVVRFVAE
mgnify:CR=1 FL=1